MNASELANKMLEWEKARNDLDLLEQEISEAVLKLGKTQTVGNVRATYSKGRTTLDYETAWMELGMSTGIDIEKYQKVTYDYCSACKDGNIEEIPVLKQVDPSVSIKLMKEQSCHSKD